MISNMEKIKDLMYSANIKPTFERLSILQYLQKRHNHPTALMIYKEVVKQIPTISKTTVYNALKLFTERGLVTPLYITGSEVRYDLVEHNHHHFLCERCGKIIDLDIGCPIFEKKTYDGHKITEQHGYFRGICKSCLQKEKK